jgi:hypothetical protein
MKKGIVIGREREMAAPTMASLASLSCSHNHLLSKPYKTYILVGFLP